MRGSKRWKNYRNVFLRLFNCKPFELGGNIQFYALLTAVNQMFGRVEFFDFMNKAEAKRIPCIAVHGRTGQGLPYQPCWQSARNTAISLLSWLTQYRLLLTNQTAEMSDWLTATAKSCLLTCWADCGPGSARACRLSVILALPVRDGTAFTRSMSSRSPPGTARGRTEGAHLGRN